MTKIERPTGHHWVCSPKFTIRFPITRLPGQALRLRRKIETFNRQGPARSDDESIDELAGEALLKNIPKQLAATESLRSELITDELVRPNSSRSYCTAIENRDQPSPAQAQAGEPLSQFKIARKPLAPKPANLKIRVESSAARSAGKAQVSPPILQSSTVQAVNELSKPGTPLSVKTSPFIQTGIEDPVELNRKISRLLRQAAAQEAESKQKTTVLAQELAKPSPRQRARQAVAWASKAVKGKLRGSPSADSSPPQISLDIEQSSKVNLLPNPSTHDVRDEGLARRMAEGLNLSNPKIQSITGASKVPRRPLPIYESMKSRQETSVSSTNPFLDDSDSDEASLKSPDLSTSGIELAPVSFTTTPQSESHINLRNTRSDNPTKGLKSQATGTGFSTELSGLAQHSDTLYFSSSPEATSTPPIRLREKRSDILRKEVNNHFGSTSRSNAYALVQSKDISPLSASTASKTTTDGSLSVKRKSAQENLRSLVSPASKKPKVLSRRHDEEADLVAYGLIGLDTQDLKSGPSPPAPDQRRKQRPQGKANLKRKGLAIFDIGKGKAPEERDEERPVVRKRPTDGVNVKRSSFSRPNSMLFGIDRKQSGKRKFIKLDADDAMDVDELA